VAERGERVEEVADVGPGDRTGRGGSLADEGKCLVHDFTGEVHPCPHQMLNDRSGSFNPTLLFSQKVV
jgi:hypothetical protein